MEKNMFARVVGRSGGLQQLVAFVSQGSCARVGSAAGSGRKVSLCRAALIHSMADSGANATSSSLRKRDAPGWSEDVDGSVGPVCWKCQGTGVKKSVKKDAPTVTCTICKGQGRTTKKVLRKKPKSTKSRELPEGYDIPGPLCANARVDINEDIETTCSLLGHWKIIQSHRGGHRWSTDDLVTAYIACCEASKLPRVNRHMDLGCGIGTVLLMTNWYFSKQAPRGIGIEAQSTSADKAKRSIILNGVSDRLSVVNEDFRSCDDSVRKLISEPFDLVTGTPPYFPVVFNQETGVAHPGFGGLPTFEQSAPARFEFRGGFEDYLLTATRFVSMDGYIVVCEGMVAAPPRELERATLAAEQSGLSLIRSVLVHGRDDKPALFTVHVFVKKGSPLQREFVKERFDVRHVGGKRTEQYLKMCSEMGIAPFNDEQTGKTG